MKVILYTEKGRETWAVKKLTLPIASGQVCVCEGHEPSIWRLVEGEVIGVDSKNNNKSITSFGGIVHVHENGVEISIDTKAQRA